MLPDFPALKAEVQKILMARLRQRVETADPLLSQIKRSVQREGRQMRYEQLEGSTIQEGFEEVTAKFEISIDEVPFLYGEKLDAKLEAIAQQVVEGSAKMFFKKMDESCQRAGTAKDARGAPISPELLLDMLNTVQMEFDPDGKSALSLVIHPNMGPALEKVTQEIENDPELKRRHTEILERQRNAWLARESNRKLVD